MKKNILIHIAGGICGVLFLCGVYGMHFVQSVQGYGVSISVAYAQTTNPTQPSGNSAVTGTSGTRTPRLDNPLKVNSITEVIELLIQIALRLAYIVAVLAIMYSGFLFVKAQGNEDEISKAKGIFWNTIIGVALIFGANILVNIIMATINSLRS